MKLTKYKMGITINGTPLPDPSSWNYEVADLDTEAARSVTGLLHRTRVATKVNYEFQWKGLTWEELEGVLELVKPDKFELTAPDPLTFKTMYTGDYYVGNRTGSAYYYWEDRDENSVFSLKMKLIEY